MSEPTLVWDLDHTVMLLLREQLKMVNIFLILFFFNCSIFPHTEPAAVPQNVTASAISSTAIEVSWEEVPAIDQNGVISIYEVRFVPLETFGDMLVTDTVNTSGPVLNITLTGLEEYVEYNISVRAYTSVGPGPYSDGVVNRTEEDGECSSLRTRVAALFLSLTQSLLHLLRM